MAVGRAAGRVAGSAVAMCGSSAEGVGATVDKSEAAGRAGVVRPLSVTTTCAAGAQPPNATMAARIQPLIRLAAIYHQHSRYTPWRAINNGLYEQNQGHAAGLLIVGRIPARLKQ